MFKLSKAQQDVSNLLTQGMTNKEIADKLFVCEKTVKFHVTAILKLSQSDTRHRYIAKFYLNLLPQSSELS
jgi:DNA-binding NarL/FixJ family response regulator